MNFNDRLDMIVYLKKKIDSSMVISVSMIALFFVVYNDITNQADFWKEKALKKEYIFVPSDQTTKRTRLNTISDQDIKIKAREIIYLHQVVVDDEMLNLKALASYMDKNVRDVVLGDLERRNKELLSRGVEQRVVEIKKSKITRKSNTEFNLNAVIVFEIKRKDTLLQKRTDYLDIDLRVQAPSGLDPWKIKISKYRYSDKRNI